MKKVISYRISLLGFLSRFTGLLLLVMIMALTGCASTKPYQIDLMPAPDVYDQSEIDPFVDSSFVERGPEEGILYATDREPVGEGDKERFYRNARGYVLRLGLAHVEMSIEDITWEEAKQISLLKNRTSKYPLQVSGVEEFGILADSYTVFDDPTIISADPLLPGHNFAERINEKLARSKKKDIFIYVHGYKVVFDNPMLVAMELWHFLGYEGVFIAYAWPSTPSRWAYFADLETAALSTRNLRLFLKYLARETRAEKIHILGYSAGTRLVIDTLGQLAMLHENDDQAELHKELKIDNVILTGSDYDLDLFGGLVVDGLLKVAEHHTIYLSGTDKALGISNWVFGGRNRLGQVWRDLEKDSSAIEFLRDHDELIVIDVSEAEQSASGNGHAYFRKSPWVSSDILATLRYGLAPADRGLVHSEELPIWTFPADYIDKLQSVLIEVNPDLSRDRDKTDASR